MEFRVLGPLEVHSAGGPLPLGSGRRLRTLLALFLAQPNRVLSTDALVDGLWPGEPPPSSSTGLRVHLTRLRARLEPERTRDAPSERLVTEPGGYRLRIGPDELDALRFEQLVTLARRAAVPAVAIDVYAEADALWRGAAFADLDDVDQVRAEAVRLSELRINALEESFEVRLALGDHAALVAVMQRAVDEHPLRERLAAQLMLALYRSGRQAEALRVCGQLRTRLGEELGIEPDLAVSRLETAIIRHEPDLDLVVPPSIGLAAAPRPATVLAADPLVLTRVQEPAGVPIPAASGDDAVLAFDAPADALACAAACLEIQGDTRVGVSVSAWPDPTEPNEFVGREAIALRRAATNGSALAAESVVVIAGHQSRLTFDAVAPVVIDGEPVGAAVGRLPVRTRADEVMPLPRLLAEEDDAELAGRAAELERLDRARRAVDGGAFRVVLVHGEAGVGKTRLAARVARLAHDDGWTVLYGRCEDNVGIPFQTFVGPLAHFVDHTPDDALANRLGRHAGGLVRLLPALAPRLPGVDAPVSSDSETERYQLFEAVADWLRANARERPLMLVVDDLHWAAPPTLLLLRHLVRTIDLDGLLLLITYRDTKPEFGEALEELLGDLSREARVDRCALDGLDVAAVRSLLSGASDRPRDDATDDLARMLQAETGGNPFFVRELLRQLPEEDAAHGGSPNVTPTIRDVVAQRFARLPPDVERLLTVAAVVGPEFDFALLREAAGVDEDEVLYTLDAARAAGLVLETGFDEYRFAHALVQAALYQPLTDTRRVRLHRRVGEALERLVAVNGSARLPELAHHFLEAAPAGDVERAVRYTLAAAEASMQSIAFEDAADLCRRALGAVEGGAAAGASLDPVVACDLVLLLGQAEWRAGQAGARRRLLRAFEMASALGDPDRVARAALAMNRGFFARIGRSDRDLVAALEHAIEVQDPGAGRLRAELLASLASELVWTDERERRHELSDEALALARAAGDRRTLASVLLLRNMTIASPDTIAQRFGECDELLAIARDLRDPAVEFQAAFHRSGTALEAGDAVAANEMVERAGQLARDLNQPSLLFQASMMRTSRCILEGALDTAEAGAREMYDLGQRANQGGEAVIYFTELMLEIRRWQGRLGDMLPEFQDLAGVDGVDLGYPLVRYLYDAGDRERALDLYAGIIEREPLPPQRDLLVGPMLCNLAYLAARAGDVTHARELYDMLVPLAGSFANSTVAKPIAEHFLGMLAATFDDGAVADAHFAVAAAAHERIGAPLLVGDTKLEWAELLLRSDEAARADELLRDAHAIGTTHAAAYLSRVS